VIALGLLLAIGIGVALGFFGGGGSILTVPLLVYVFGLEPKVAIASSLVIVGIASCSGTLQHWRAGNLRWQTGALFGAAGMAGAYLGGRAGAFLDGGVLLLLFASTMVLTSLAMWKGRSAGTETVEGGSNPGRLVAQGFAVGLFTGLVGAGGGFLIVPALALWAGLPMAAAVGTSLFVIVLKSVAGFLGYLSHVSVDYGLVASVAASAIVGSFVGSRLTRVVSPASLRRGFAGFVFAMAVLVLVREGAAVAATAEVALPRTLPQVLFALLVLGVGVLAGRASRSATGGADVELLYESGGGI
jgi:uncharacterized membrane protein YfcA